MNGLRGLQQLQLRQADIARRVDALFKTMSTDFLLREQFVTEPAQLLNEYVHGRKLPDDQIQDTDRFIYPVMSSAPGAPPKGHSAAPPPERER